MNVTDIDLFSISVHEFIQSIEKEFINDNIFYQLPFSDTLLIIFSDILIKMSNKNDTLLLKIFLEFYLNLVRLSKVFCKSFVKFHCLNIVIKSLINMNKNFVFRQQNSGSNCVTC